MAQITAAAVKALRTRTGLPMMDCKRALAQSEGNEDAAVKKLRERGEIKQEQQSGRATSSGRIAIYTDFDSGLASMIEFQCETSPVANHEEFVQLADDLAKQLATGPGAATPQELLAQASPSKSSSTLQEQYDELYNRIREAFKLSRIVRIDTSCGGYVHHDGSTGVLLQVEGGGAELARDICMHVAAIRPAAVSQDDLDPAEVDKEREIQKERARQEGKPENIIEKMVEGRMKNYYAESCLLAQPFVKDDSKTVGAVAEEGGMKVVKFVRWVLGEE